MILVKDKFDCNVIAHQVDEQGRFIILKGVFRDISLSLLIFIPLIRPRLIFGE